jgi:hypothetical protein
VVRKLSGDDGDELGARIVIQLHITQLCVLRMMLRALFALSFLKLTRTYHPAVQSFMVSSPGVFVRPSITSQTRSSVLRAMMSDSLDQNNKLYVGNLSFRVSQCLACAGLPYDPFSASCVARMA